MLEGTSYHSIYLQIMKKKVKLFFEKIFVQTKQKMMGIKEKGKKSAEK